MEKHLSIVKVDKRHYRTIARENWGLTKEQMRGRHVHHRISVSDGGTNDPSNLYVCSPKFHAEVWHNGEEFIEWANEGGRKGGTKAAELGVGAHAPGMASKGGTKSAELGVGVHAPEMRGVGGTKSSELGVGVHGRSAEQMAEDGRKGGTKAAELGVGVCGRSAEQMTEDGRKGGTKAAELGVGIHAPGVRSNAAKTTNSQKWVCLDTGHSSNAGALSRWQKARGIDTSLRKRVV
jgi:hypothetical protein